MENQHSVWSCCSFVCWGFDWLIGLVVWFGCLVWLLDGCLDVSCLIGWVIVWLDGWLNICLFSISVYIGPIIWVTSFTIVLIWFHTCLPVRLFVSNYVYKYVSHLCYIVIQWNTRFKNDTQGTQVLTQRFVLLFYLVHYVTVFQGDPGTRKSTLWSIL